MNPLPDSFAPPREVHQLERLAKFDVRFRLEGESRLLTNSSDDRIVFRGLSDLHRLMRQIRQLQHQRIERCIRLRQLLVERGNSVAEIPGFRLLRFGLGGFLLPHQGADFLRHPVALRLERLDFRQDFPPLLVESEQFVNFGLIPCPARRQARTHKIGFFTDQFDVEHERNLRNALGSGKPIGFNAATDEVIG